MLTSADYDAISPVTPTQRHQVNLDRDVHNQPVTGPKYDSVTLSSQTEESRFHQEMVSRLSKEVRTATSTGDIQRLRKEVAEGTYEPDPMRIAAKILYLDEEAE
jgi:negative regulator of flagellin synthesis FlgM